MCFPCSSSKESEPLIAAKPSVMVVNENPRDMKSRKAALRAAKGALAPNASTAPSTLDKRSLVPISNKHRPHTK